MATGRPGPEPIITKGHAAEYHRAGEDAEPAECTDCGQKRGDLCRHDPKTTAICFDDVSVNFGGVQVLDSVTARIRVAAACIVGPNGAGKTTLLMTLLGKISHSGAVRIGSTPDGRAARVGYVPQRLAFDRGMPLTVMEFLAMGSQRRPCGSEFPAISENGRPGWKWSGGALARRRVGALSGGELQRVLLALAFQQDPDLLILDEPAAGVDFRGGQIFCELLENLRPSTASRRSW